MPRCWHSRHREWIDQAPVQRNDWAVLSKGRTPNRKLYLPEIFGSVGPLKRAKAKNNVCSKLRSPPDFSSVIVIEKLFSNNRAAPKRQMAFRKRSLRLAFSLLLASALAVQVKAASTKGPDAESKATPTPTATPNFKPESTTSTGSVIVEGSP